MSGAPNLNDYWPCACVKGREATLKIKLNHKSVKCCRACKCVRPDNWLDRNHPTAKGATDGE